MRKAVTIVSQHLISIKGHQSEFASGVVSVKLCQIRGEKKIKFIYLLKQNEKKIKPFFLYYLKI